MGSGRWGDWEIGRLGEGTRLNGMMNIGVRPTVDGTKRTIEINLFDFLMKFNSHKTA